MGAKFSFIQSTQILLTVRNSATETVVTERESPCFQQLIDERGPQQVNQQLSTDANESEEGHPAQGAIQGRPLAEEV